MNCRSEEKVNEFLREISPMREAAFWHDFIGRCFLPENGVGIVNLQLKPRLRRHEINANINNVNTVQSKAKLPPPPLPPKPKLFKVSHLSAVVASVALLESRKTREWSES